MVDGRGAGRGHSRAERLFVAGKQNHARLPASAGAAAAARACGTLLREGVGHDSGPRVAGAVGDGPGFSAVPAGAGRP